MTCVNLLFIQTSVGLGQELKTYLNLAELIKTWSGYVLKNQGQV